MPYVISVFNNKGGVGKTTYMYHIAHLLCKRDKTVLMVDCDSQCNLTSYTMSDAQIEASWREKGNSIYRAIEPVYRGIGDIRFRSPINPKPDYKNLFLVPGDLTLSNYEDILGDSWSSAKGGSEPSIRIQSAIHRYIRWAAAKIKADVVLIDLGPNLGALNRAVLGGSDYFIVPVSPDLFSIKGTENLGDKLVIWNREWLQCNEAWSSKELEIPQGKPTFLGYVIQQHNLRSNDDGMTKGWKIFGDRLEVSIQSNIVDKLKKLNQVIEWTDGNYHLGKIPNLHSLIPYSLEARKPVFDCTTADGLKGAHYTRAKESVDHFKQIVDIIQHVIEKP